jgi:hypothetical protein
MKILLLLDSTPTMTTMRVTSGTRSNVFTIMIRFKLHVCLFYVLYVFFAEGILT